VYPVSQGFAEVTVRLSALINNGHHSEALLASVFALEKTIRRSLRFCALNRGFSSKQCDSLFANMGFRAMTEAWPVFEKYHRTLPIFIGNEVWQHVPEAVTMRNKMVHGARVYQQAECKKRAELVQKAMEELRNKSIADLGCDPWSLLLGRNKSSLSWLSLKQS
jgi:hypothetical protein